MITNSWKQLYVLKEWTDQEAVVHPPNEILSNKEGTHSTEGSQRHDTRWEKAVSEGYLCILSDSIYITSFKGQNYGDRVEITGWHGLRVVGGYDYKETAWGNFWGHGIALHSDYGGGSINMDDSSIHELIYVQKLIELYVFLNSQV